MDGVSLLGNKFDSNVFRASAVQHERGPRNSTLGRQMALFYKEPNSMPPADLAGAWGVASAPPLLQPPPPHPPVSDLALPRATASACFRPRLAQSHHIRLFQTSPCPEPPHQLLQTPTVFCSTAALPKVKLHKLFVSCVDYTEPNDDVQLTALRHPASSSPATGQNQWNRFLRLRASQQISLA